VNNYGICTLERAVWAVEGEGGIMCFQKIIDIVNAVMPLIAVFVAGLYCHVLLDKWYSRKMRCCYNSLISCFDKFCRNLGCKSLLCTFREDYFDNDSDIESLIKDAQSAPPPPTDQNWRNAVLRYQFKTALNNARTKVGLEARNFFLSRHFLNNKYGELLAVLTVNKNTAEMKAFYRGDWECPKNKKKSKLQKWLNRIKIRFFGYDRPDYSIMLV
jgi:hypothetical protein